MDFTPLDSRLRGNDEITKVAANTSGHCITWSGREGEPSDFREAPLRARRTPEGCARRPGIRTARAMKKAVPLERPFLLVGARGFEPPTTCTPCRGICNKTKRAETLEPCFNAQYSVCYSLPTVACCFRVLRVFCYPCVTPEDTKGHLIRDQGRWRQAAWRCSPTRKSAP